MESGNLTKKDVRPGAPDITVCIPTAKVVTDIISSIYKYIIGQVYFRTVNHFPIIKQRIRDPFIQNWSETIHTMPKLDYFCKFKREFKFEDYLINITNNEIRKNLTRLRLSAHKLAIKAGRYSGVERENRICEHCNYNTVESEYHYLLICPKYYELRLKYLPRVAWPTINKYINIMTTKNSKLLFNIAKYTTEALKIRTQTINT